MVWGLVLLVFLQFSRKSKKTLSSFIKSSHFPSVFQKKPKKPKIQDRSAMGEGRFRDEGGLTSSEYVRFFWFFLENCRKISTFCQGSLVFMSFSEFGRDFNICSKTAEGFWDADLNLDCLSC